MCAYINRHDMVEGQNGAENGVGMLLGGAQ
jgi:hypothetical protein